MELKLKRLSSMESLPHKVLTIFSWGSRKAACAGAGGAFKVIEPVFGKAAAEAGDGVPMNVARRAVSKTLTPAQASNNWQLLSKRCSGKSRRSSL